jgi:hypothetical protein
MDTSFCLDALQDTLRKGPRDIFNTYGGTPADQIDWPGRRRGAIATSARGSAARSSVRFRLGRAQRKAVLRLQRLVKMLNRKVPVGVRYAPLPLRSDRPVTGVVKRACGTGR